MTRQRTLESPVNWAKTPAAVGGPAYAPLAQNLATITAAAVALVDNRHAVAAEAASARA